MGSVARLALRLVTLLRPVLRVAALGWALTSAYWLIARYGRRGPMLYRLRWMLDWAPRRLFFPARPVLERSLIAPGGTVLELGPGTGFFSVEAASMVGEKGRLLCLDVQRPMLGDLSSRLREAGVANADLLLADGSRLPLRDGCLDSALLVAVLGQVLDRVGAVAELRRVLKPGGVLSVTEYLSDPDYLFEDAGRDLCRAMGFEPLEHYRGVIGYTMNFAAP